MRSATNSIASPGDPRPDPYDAFCGPGNEPWSGPLRAPTVVPGAEEPPRQSLESSACTACTEPDEGYVWVSERWRVRSTRRPTGLPLVLGLEVRPHLDLGDLPNLLAAELGVMTVRLEKAMRSLPGVAQVHVSRWGDDESHLRVWFLARPAGALQLRGPYLAAWDRALPPVDERAWRDRLGAVAVWLAEFGGRAIADPPRIDWQNLSRSGAVP